jgi:hypothetical protein
MSSASFIFDLLIAVDTRCALQKFCVLLTVHLCVFLSFSEPKVTQHTGKYDHVGVCLLRGVLLVQYQFPRIRNSIALIF